MITVGLTGGIATGKSTVADLLRGWGVPVIDADQVAREVVAPGSPGLAEVVAAFGPEVLVQGALDRKALGRRVVADPEARRRLDAITHPRIGAAVMEALADLAQAGHAVAVVEAALMVETGSWRHYDHLVVVTCDPGTQRARLMAREGMDEATAGQWLAAQLPQEEKERVASAVIRNDGTREQLAAATRRAWEALGLPGSPAA